MAPVGIHNHRHRVPADVTLDAHFHFPIAGKLGLLLGNNRVDVRRADDARDVHAGFAQAFREAAEELRGALGAALFQRDFEERLQRLQNCITVTVVVTVLVCFGRRAQVTAARARLRLFFFFFLRFHFKITDHAVIMRRGKIRSPRVNQHGAPNARQM